MGSLQASPYTRAREVETAKVLPKNRMAPCIALSRTPGDKSSEESSLLYTSHPLSYSEESGKLRVSSLLKRFP